jgi:hypothetical protein
MDVRLYDLILEVTRKCNLQCGHCLRGNAEDKTLNMKFVENVFKTVNSISTLTLTGGEPFLHPEIIDNILFLAEKHDVEISNFYIATNGTIPLKNVIQTVMNLYTYCTENDVSQIKISNDEFHCAEGDYTARKKIMDEWSILKFVHIDSANISNSLIAEGRWKWGNGRQLLEPSIMEVEQYSDMDSVYVESELYLNCHGNLIAGCDFSYENQEKEVVIYGRHYELLEIINKNLALQEAI